MEQTIIRPNSKSEPMPIPRLDPSLKLTFCPRCDYSLQGLPDTGICPECGDAYTQDFIVLRGRPVTTGDEPNGQKHAASFSPLSHLFSAVIFALFMSGMPVAMAVLLAALFGWGIFDALLIRLSTVRRNEVLVWLAPAGIGEQSYIDPASLAGRYVSASRTGWRVSRTPIVAGLCVAMFTQHIIASAIVTAVLFIPACIIDRGRRPAGWPAHPPVIACLAARRGIGHGDAGWPAG